VQTVDDRIAFGILITRLTKSRKCNHCEMGKDFSRGLK